MPFGGEIPYPCPVDTATWFTPGLARVFATTRWSVIIACKKTEGAQEHEALAELCQSYWKPVYACIRHHGHAVHDAQDLTQEFFMRLLKGSCFDHLDEAKGRFRAYLSTALRNFLRDHHRRRCTFRRGRGTIVVPLECESAEGSYAQMRATATPETLYELHWAQTVIELAFEQLRIEMRADGKEALLDHFDAVLTASTHQFPYAEIAHSLHMTVGALHSALHRCRQRFQMLLREEIGRTVTSKAAVDDELRYLRRVFGQVT